MAKRGKALTDVKVSLDRRVLDRKLATLVRQTSDLRPLWPFIHRAFMLAEAAWFASRGGGTWKPHSLGYKDWLAAHGGGNGLLRRDGDLFRSLTGKTKKSIYRANKRSVVMGSRSPSAHLHAYGTKPRRPGGTLPVRKPVIKATFPPFYRVVNAEVAGFARDIERAWDK